MKSMIKQKPWIRVNLLIFIGTALMSIALKSAFDTNGIVDGGFSGIAIIVKSVTEPLLPGGIPLGVTNLLLNIPMFFLGIKIMGFGFMAKTIWGYGQSVFLADRDPGDSTGGGGYGACSIDRWCYPGNRYRSGIFRAWNHRGNGSGASL